MAGNEAVSVNPSSVGISLTSHGSDFLWAMFCVFAASAVTHGFFLFAHQRKHNKYRVLLHAAPLYANVVLTIAYFTLASNLGWAGVKPSWAFHHIDIGNGVRQVFYAKFVGYFCAYPAVLFLFEYAAQLENGLASFEIVQFLTNLLVQICCWAVFVLGLLIGSVIQSTYKWGYWTFSAVSILFGLTLLNYRQFFSSSAARNLPTIISASFFSLCGVLYLVSFGLSEGANVIQPDSEAVFYGILDFVTFFAVPSCLTWNAVRQGIFEEAPKSASADLEKNIGSPEMRASGETEVNATNQDVDQLNTQHA